LKSSIFCDITPYSPLKVSQRFGGTVAFFFKVKETSVEQVANRALLASQQINRRFIPEDISPLYYFSDSAKHTFPVALNEEKDR
jgi:hypothetical protein